MVYPRPDFVPRLSDNCQKDIRADSTELGTDAFTKRSPEGVQCALTCSTAGSGGDLSLGGKGITAR
ncbi:MAG: hypothetical protein ACFFBD_01280 [Candidatus Hodarchaeota archaeon]